LATRLSLPEQLEFARQAARSKEAPVREAALDLLKTMDDDDAIAVFDQMLQAAAAQESESICIALGEMGSAKAIRLLRDYQERAARKENASALSAAEHGLNVWRSRRPGWNYVQQGHEHQFREKKEAEALKYYTVAITINPDLGDAYSARAGIRLHQNKLDQAAADFRRALELDAFDHQAVTGLAIVLAMQGDWQQAVQFVADQAGHFPRNEYFAYNSACVCGRAIETLRKQPASEERDRVIAQLQTQAIERLRTALSLGFNQFAWMKEDPDLISLHDLPAFQQLQRTD
jgi:tetratricopeptide (TPR) repeat protein